MLTATIGELRSALSDFVERVEKGGDRVILTRHGHPAAALINLDDLRIIERIDRQIDEIIARAVLDELRTKNAIPWDEALAKLASRRKEDSTK